MSAAKPIGDQSPVLPSHTDADDLAKIRAVVLNALGTSEESPPRPLLELVERLCRVNLELRERMRHLAVAFGPPS